MSRVRGMKGTGEARRRSRAGGGGTGYGLGTLREDLLHFEAAPLPPSLWLRWLPHGVVCLIAVTVIGTGASLLSETYGQNAQYALLLSLAQGAAVLLALWRPVPAWLLSTAAAVMTALGARSQLISGQAEGDPAWPWAAPALVGHALVLLLLALRVPTRVAVEALAVTVLATYLIEGVVGAAGYEPTGVTAVAVFAAVTLLGTALHGRREARHRLEKQEEITAEERARRTLLEERSRIARELHDVVAHHMSVISIQAQVAPHLVRDPPEELKENLAGIRQNAVEALTELRRVLGVLRSELPEDLDGLGEAVGGSNPDAPQPNLDRLEALIDNTRTAGLTVNTRVIGEPAGPYPPGVELSAYRIVQEALSNVLRHAPGTSVTVEVTHFRDGLYLGVINSRPQQPVPPSPGAGHGLLGMRERAAMLGGHLCATRMFQGGFAVTAFLPREGGAAAPRHPDPRFEPEVTFPDDSQIVFVTGDESP
ncbi:sensor histidine kinase [Streptomyces sp. NPDC006458]|uniref:sensor histidine kinase n=1 Tax=Streptomyces sp. NPDC006458 TaxID=3154302 RepID=UPI0033BECF0C